MTPQDPDPKLQQQDHPLTRPEMIRKLWMLGGAVLVVLLLLDLVVLKHPYFAIEGLFGFGAWFGFGVAVVLVFGALTLGAVLRRREGYYDD